ncbi:MAG: cell division protein FtsL [Candidatus Aminicenantia bacterium]
MFKRKNLSVFFGVLLISFAVAIFYIYLHTENVRIGYEIEKLRKERDELMERIEILESEKAKLTSLKRVEKKAEELGMKKLEWTQICIVRVQKEKNLKTMDFIGEGIKND